MANNEKVNAVNPSNGMQSQEYQLQYLQEILGLSAEQLSAAIQEVGPDKDKLASFLRSQASKNS
jgi:hypothetical protein